jgi:hypothetical protein
LPLSGRVQRIGRGYPVIDAEFVAGVQKSADWLTGRRVLPENADHLAQP